MIKQITKHINKMTHNFLIVNKAQCLINKASCNERDETQHEAVLHEILSAHPVCESSFLWGFNKSSVFLSKKAKCLFATNYLSAMSKCLPIDGFERV